MAEEALACFESLLESVPEWIVDLESILTSATETQLELQRANSPAGEDLVEGPPEKRPKIRSSSLRSRRSRDGSQSGRAIENRLLRRPSLRYLTNSDALRLSQRKRKTASVCSRDQSGPSKFRTKAAAVVYYDGSTQCRFEKLVRAIGSSRNSIRKGKMSAKVDSLSRTGSSSSSSGASDEDDSGPRNAGLAYKSTRQQRGIGFGLLDDTEAFDRVDKRLETAQTLCERAAHQILRDGDCRQEVDNAKEEVAEARTLAERELPALRKKVEKAAARQRRSQERHRVEAEQARQAEVERKPPSRDTSAEKIQDLAGTAAEGGLGADTLEVDDESDDDATAFDLDAIQFGKLGPMRRTRFATAY